MRRHLQHSPHTCKETDVRQHLQYSPRTCKETFGDTYNTVNTRAKRLTFGDTYSTVNTPAKRLTFGDTYNTVYNTPAARHSSTPAIQSTHLQRDIQRHLQYSQHTRKETIGDTSLHTRKETFGDTYNTVHTPATRHSAIPTTQSIHPQRDIRRYLQHSPYTRNETFGDTYNTVHTPATRHSATARVQHDTDLQLTTLSVVKEGARGMVRGGMPGAFSTMFVPRTSV